MTKKYYRPSKYGLNEHTWRWNSYTVLKLTLINLWHLVHLLVYELPFSNQKKPSTDGLGPALCLFTPWSLPEIFLLGIILVYWIPFFLCNRFVSHIRLVLLTLTIIFAWFWKFEFSIWKMGLILRFYHDDFR